jgi:hypothetical protein
MHNASPSLVQFVPPYRWTLKKLSSSQKYGSSSTFASPRKNALPRRTLVNGYPECSSFGWVLARSAGMSLGVPATNVHTNTFLPSHPRIDTIVAHYSFTAAYLSLFNIIIIRRSLRSLRRRGAVVPTGGEYKTFAWASGEATRDRLQTDHDLTLVGKTIYRRTYAVQKSMRHSFNAAAALAATFCLSSIAYADSIPQW